jgi:glycosyltransferase involved in cell wall biosynthesis
MFVLNNCKYDTRVLNEARTLADAGHNVRIIAILDEQSEPYEEINGFRIVRIALDPVNRRAIGAIMDAERYAGSFILRPILRLIVRLIAEVPVWAYHRMKRRSARFPRRVEQPRGSASREIEETSTATSHEIKQPSKSAFHKLGLRILSCAQNVAWHIAWDVIWGITWSIRGRARTHLNRVLQAINRPFDTAFFFRDYWQRSWRAIRDEPADIYHCHDLNTLPVGYKAKRRTAGKLVYDSHELFAELHYFPRLERWILRLLEAFLIRCTDAVITVNEFAARELSRRYRIGLPVVVRNCPPLARQINEGCNGSLREWLGLDDTVTIIVHVGIFKKSRGSEKLVSAAPFLNDGVIVFLGWSNEEAELKELVRSRGLEDRVFFATPVAPGQVVTHISSAQVGVVLFRNFSLNHYYATPNKLWEYMNAGLPVVASNFPVLKAIVEDYRLGCTCNPEDPQDIANAINYILSDRSRYEEMKKNALEAAKIFNWENESVRLLEVYMKFSQSADDRTASPAWT